MQSHLSNADLDEGTSTNAKSDLIKYAKNIIEKESLEISKPQTIPITALASIQVCAEELNSLNKSLPESPECFLENVSHGFVERFMEIGDGLQKAFRTAESCVENEPKKLPSIHNLFVDKEHDLCINQDDAVIIVRKLNQASSRQHGPTSTQELHYMVDRRIETSLLSYQPADKSEVENKNSYRKRCLNIRADLHANKPRNCDYTQQEVYYQHSEPKNAHLSNLFPDGEKICLHCGSQGHDQGDQSYESPGWMTSRPRDLRETVSKAEKADEQFFCKSSKRGFAKHH